MLLDFCCLTYRTWSWDRKPKLKADLLLCSLALPVQLFLQAVLRDMQVVNVHQQQVCQSCTQLQDVWPFFRSHHQATATGTVFKTFYFGHWLRWGNRERYGQGKQRTEKVGELWRGATTRSGRTQTRIQKTLVTVKSSSLRKVKINVNFVLFTSIRKYQIWFLYSVKCYTRTDIFRLWFDTQNKKSMVTNKKHLQKFTFLMEFNKCFL